MMFEIVTSRWFGYTRLYELCRDGERAWVATFRTRGDAIRFAERQGARVIFPGEN
jgi:hypothetical protein